MPLLSINLNRRSVIFHSALTDTHVAFQLSNICIHGKTVCLEFLTYVTLTFFIELELLKREWQRN